MMLSHPFAGAPELQLCQSALADQPFLASQSKRGKWASGNWAAVKMFQEEICHFMANFFLPFSFAVRFVSTHSLAYKWATETEPCSSARGEFYYPT
jgi:hypothetical protein